MVGRHSERDPRVADLPLRADEPLRQRRLGEQEGAGDLGRLQAADEAKRERHLRVRGERRVAAGEDEAQPFVRDRALVHVLLGGRDLLEPRQQLGLALEVLVAADAVDGAVAGRGDDPGTRVVRHAVARPALERDGERVLHCVLRAVEVAERARQVGERPAPLLAKGTRDRLYAPASCSTSGRISTEPRLAIGTRAAMSIASSRSLHSRMKRPPMSSFVSANGPSVTTARPSS